IDDDAAGRDPLEAGVADAGEDLDLAKLVWAHARFIPCAASSSAGEAAVAEREPRRRRRAAGAAAADRRRRHLRAEPDDDLCGGSLLERSRALDRDAAHARVLEREPAQDARRAACGLGVLERRRAKAAGVEQVVDEGALSAVAGDREGERAQQLE